MTDKSVAIDDRSGFKEKHKNLKKEWTGMMVHKRDWEEKHPALTPIKVPADRKKVRNARPDNDDMGTVTQTLAAALLARGDPVTHGDTTT